MPVREGVQVLPCPASCLCVAPIGSCVPRGGWGVRFSELLALCIRPPALCACGEVSLFRWVCPVLVPMSLRLMAALPPRACGGYLAASAISACFWVFLPVSCLEVSALDGGFWEVSGRFRLYPPPLVSRR